MTLVFSKMPRTPLTTTTTTTAAQENSLSLAEAITIIALLTMERP